MVCINGGIMKQLFTQKWVLSSLLIAALGSQYYFSVSSKNIGAIDMASEQLAPQILDINNVLQKLKENKESATIKPETTPAVDDSTKKALMSAVEGKSSAVPCSDCVILTRRSY